jgi:hypothetical protein
MVENGDGGPSDGDDAPAGWREIDLGGIKPTDSEIPFRLFANRFKSSTVACEAFIHDPLTALIEAGAVIDPSLGIDSSWKVATFVTNHHRTLSKVHLFALAAVSADEKTISITTVKRPPPAE